MKTIKLKLLIEINQKSPFQGFYEIRDQNMTTFKDVKDVFVAWWRKEKETTWMPWGKLCYQTPRLTWRGQSIGPGKKVKLEEVVFKKNILLKAVMKLTKKEKNKQSDGISREKERAASRTNKCANMQEAAKVKEEQHKKNIEKNVKKVKRKVKRKGRMYDARVMAAAREQGLNVLKVGFRNKVLHNFYYIFI